MGDGDFPVPDANGNAIFVIKAEVTVFNEYRTDVETIVDHVRARVPKFLARSEDSFFIGKCEINAVRFDVVVIVVVVVVVVIVTIIAKIMASRND